MRLQSAMEYLMTYGWAILIIAIVLGALFQLGVFNSTNFAPRAPPGSCRIFRSPAGGSPNLEGVCTGQLPQFVGVFGGNVLKGYITSQSSYNVKYISVVAWIKIPTFLYSSSLDSEGVVSTGAQGASGGWDLAVYPSGVLPMPYFYVTYNFPYSSNRLQVNGPGTLTLNTWHFMAGTYDGSTVSVYVDGALANSGSASGTVQNNLVAPVIGELYYNPGSSVDWTWFSGDIANVQIYNVSLSAGDIQTLYLRGIGGAPLNLRNIIGWWPLNGDANDYGGNNNGVPTSLVYTNQWLSGYTPP